MKGKDSFRFVKKQAADWKESWQRKKIT